MTLSALPELNAFTTDSCIYGWPIKSHQLHICWSMFYNNTIFFFKYPQKGGFESKCHGYHGSCGQGRTKTVMFLLAATLRLSAFLLCVSCDGLIHKFIPMHAFQSGPVSSFCCSNRFSSSPHTAMNETQLAFCSNWHFHRLLFLCDLLI